MDQISALERGAWAWSGLVWSCDSCHGKAFVSWFRSCRDEARRGEEEEDRAGQCTECSVQSTVYGGSVSQSAEC